MTGTSRCPRLIMACRAGNIFLYARSPVAPKKTSASEYVFDKVVSSGHSWFLAGLLQMAAELVAHRREKLVCKIGFASRTEPLVQRTGENRHRHEIGRASCRE